MLRQLVRAAVAVFVACVFVVGFSSRASAKVEYVKVCSLYGAGFFYVPGTDTCIKIGGYVRDDFAVQTGQGSVCDGKYFTYGQCGRESEGTRVQVCSLYGAGFYYIPGTDTCIKFGGWVRADDPRQ